MLNRTYPDPVHNSFGSETAQKSGTQRITCKNYTIADSKNQAIQTFSPEKKSRKHKKGDFVGSGNRCGHKPESPRGVAFKAEARRPFFIQKMIKAAEKLLHRPRGSKKGHGELVLTRSEGREGLVQFVKKMSYDLELSTMTVCINDINFAKPTLKDITRDSDKTGLSYDRAKRAQQKLVEGGYLSVVRSPKYKNGEFKADPSVRELTPKLFRVLGLAQEYAFQQHIKIKRLEKRAAKKGFQKEMWLKIQANISSGKKDGVKTGSFPENKAHRENLINLYVDVVKMKGSTMDTALLRSVALKMSTETLESLLKHHTHNTS